MAFDAIKCLVRFDTLTVILLGLVTLIIIVLIIECSPLTSVLRESKSSYGYTRRNGPVLWRCCFPGARGKGQSPINIRTKRAIIVPSSTLHPLEFSSEYYITPKEMRAYNDGHCITVYARWECDIRPTIRGGPLDDIYSFFCVKFRWGANDEEGSEHSVDERRYAMEVQATHVKANTCYVDTSSAAKAGAIMVVSYLYQITPIDNPYLEPFVTALPFMRHPFDTCCLDPAPLSWIVPPFCTKYYSYNGSLTYPPCTEGVTWIIQPEPLSISTRQLERFRKLFAVDGPLENNTRPVQEINNRDVYYYG